jgi:DamX protein
VLTTADEAVVAGVGEFPLTVALTQGESNSAAVVIAEEAVAAETIAAVNNGAETAKTIAEVAVAEETAVITTSSFVERLLQASPGDYAVQLLASHSQASIIDFIAQLGGEHPAGYFETRYQSKPWFVAVLASFDDRNQATAAISSLPAKLRSNEPWVRSVAGIQTDIRKLLDSKLVSVK